MLTFKLRRHVCGFDIDDAAIAVALGNVTDKDLETDIDILQCDITEGLPLKRTSKLGSASKHSEEKVDVVDTLALSVADTLDISTKAGSKADTSAQLPSTMEEPHESPSKPRLPDGPFDVAIMNPPFGTRLAGVDTTFVLQGLHAVNATGKVYSLHKSSTRSHFIRLAESLGVGLQVVAELRFDLPATYAFHREASVDIAVDLLRFVKGPEADAIMAAHSAIPAFKGVSEALRGAGDGSKGGKAPSSSSFTSPSSASSTRGRGERGRGGKGGTRTGR
jgi:predicted RNA methylase